MEASMVPLQVAWGIKDEEEEDDDELGCPSSSSSADSDECSSEFMDDATTSSPSSPSFPSSTSSPLPDHQRETAVYEMSSLMAQLPFNRRRGLSKHFHGKSQSFTSLSNVRCLEDLVKPERPCKKRLKHCKSDAGGLDVLTHNSHCPGTVVSSNASRGSRQGPLASGGGRPPAPPHRSSSFSAQTLLFA